MSNLSTPEIERVFRAEYGRVVASLVRFFGDIGLAEEAVQEAFLVALEKWPATGPPPSPAGWIITTARNRGIDRIRRESTRDDRHTEAMRMFQSDEPLETPALVDDRLRLIFTCCHPALAANAQVALTLRLIGGLQTPGLLAMMLLTESRRAARRSITGALVRLADQDRSRWHLALIAEGQAIVRSCLRRNLPGPYQIQAAIAAVHSDAATAADTDWRQIVTLYDQLLRYAPTHVVALNRAIAVAEVDGPGPALDLLADLDLSGYHLFHAARADLLQRLGHLDEAAHAYDQALSFTANRAEQALLRSLRDSLTQP